MSDDAVRLTTGREHPIGVGMGGSCPGCSAPVDLGQEFCLECGASVKRIPDHSQRAKSQPSPSVLDAAPRAGGFPWIPFVVVLGLIGLGVLFALFGSTSKPTSRKSKATTSAGGISTLTTTPSRLTITRAGCNSGQAGAAGMQGTDTQATTTGDAGASGDSAPAPLDAQSANGATANGASATATPGTSATTVPGAGGTTGGTTGTTDAGTVAVDENGIECRTTSTTTTNPTTTTPSPSPTPSPTPTPGSLNLTWPAGKNGYTVMLVAYSQASYPQTSAQQQSARAQQLGLSAGVIDSNSFSSLNSDMWVVFHGVYDTEAAATSELQKVRSSYPSAVVREIRA